MSQHPSNIPTLPASGNATLAAQNNQVAAPASAIASADQQRAIAEVQAALVIAASRPRDEIKARERLITACSRLNLAKRALYEYERGKEPISGPSIRLAEAAARAWGNMTYGFREMSRDQGKSEVEAYAWDLETNTKAMRQFAVKHWRDTKKGGYALKDERDIYELVANYAQRRVRATILEIIPGDVIEDAVRQCEITMNAEVGDIKEARKNMLAVFQPFGVLQEHIEARLGHRLDAIQAGEILRLWKIYNNIKDGVSKPEDWFDMTIKPADAATAAKAEELKGRLAKENAKPAAQDAHAAESPSGEQATLAANAPERGSTTQIPCPNLDGALVDAAQCPSCPSYTDASGMFCPSWQGEK